MNVHLWLSWNLSSWNNYFLIYSGQLKIIRSIAVHNEPFIYDSLSNPAINFDEKLFISSHCLYRGHSLVPNHWTGRTVWPARLRTLIDVKSLATFVVPRSNLRNRSRMERVTGATRSERAHHSKSDTNQKTNFKTVIFILRFMVSNKNSSK